MKVERINIDESDKMEVGVVKPIKKQTMMQSMTIYNGHTLFEINPVTGKCKIAEYETIDADLDGGVHKKVIAHQNCVYVSSLNKKNALIKFFKMVGKQIDGIKK